MNALHPSIETKLITLGVTLVDQMRAHIAIPAEQQVSGFWFGGGNISRGHDGRLFITGRYRSGGDSRSGTAKGERGKELAIFASGDNGISWEKVVSFQKEQLDHDNRSVISIEGSALCHTSDGVELYISTEKSHVSYPKGLESFQKPETGVWSIDLIQSPSVEGLANAKPKTVIYSEDSQFLHVKDPFLYSSANGTDYVLFCTHPFCWSSSNTAYVKREANHTKYNQPVWYFFPRGFTWDVAMTRGTCVLPLPLVGVLKDQQRVSLFFYDGGECVRNLDEHALAVKRPRGYSCEELGGLAYMLDDDLYQLHRLSVNFPLFVSPWGTGSSRYVNVLAEEDSYYVIWQQSQRDYSQPLVMNRVPMEKVHSILA